MLTSEGQLMYVSICLHQVVINIKHDGNHTLHSNSWYCIVYTLNAKVTRENDSAKNQ